MSALVCTTSDYEDAPRTLRDPKEQERRRALLSLPHMVPLTDYAVFLRKRGDVEVPEFDPLDGGVEAKILFLFEKPGPMTSSEGRRTGSGFISRNNDDPTAAAIFKFMAQAGIPRQSTLIWNVVPWWNGTRKITADEVRDGLTAFSLLRQHLSKLSAVVMVGEKASRVQPYLENTGLLLFHSSHPSPIVRARYRARWDAIAADWAKVLDAIQRE